VMNEHVDYIQEMTMPAEDPESDPELKPTTAAQEAEQTLMGQPGQMPEQEQPIPPDTMAG
jgi:hypothetical protein